MKTLLNALGTAWLHFSAFLNGRFSGKLVVVAAVAGFVLGALLF